MKTTTKFLVMLGAGFAAAASFAVPASAAAPSAPATPTGQVQTRDWDDDDDVAGYYDTRRECERAGRFGEWRNRWDDYDCNLIRRGWHRGDWALEVERDWRGHGNGHGGGGPRGGR